MANPYKARVDVRRFLNLPGFHSGAYVVAYVEDTSERTPKKRDCFGDSDRYVNPQPRIILELADCANRINLELDVHSDLELENSLHKIDTIVDALTELRAGLLDEARLYGDRAKGLRHSQSSRLGPSVPE